jgi:hypothetical protein
MVVKFGSGMKAAAAKFTTKGVILTIILYVDRMQPGNKPWLAPD